MNRSLPPAGYTRDRTVGDTLAPDMSWPPSEAPANFLHCVIFLDNGERLDSDTFRLVHFSGQDSASELFEYQLELHGNTSYTRGRASRLEYEDLIGRELTVGIQRPCLYSNDELVGRFIQALDGGDFPEFVLYNGIITAFAMEERGVYRVTMKPAMHRMTLTNQYEVYPSQSALDVVKSLLKKHYIDYQLGALSDPDNPFFNRRQPWLQAGESDFDFLRRLMGKAHVYFYFTHSGNTHTVWFANRAAYPPVFPAPGRLLRYTFTGADELGMHQDDVIFQYNYQCALTSSSVRGVFSRQISAWEEDPIPRLHTYAAATSGAVGSMPFTQYKIYQYGGSRDEVDQHIELTDNSMQAAAQVFSGSSYCAQFRTGHQFTVHGEVDTPGGPIPVRPALDRQRFVLTQVKVEASADGSYQNQFQSCPATGLIAAFSMQETQQGSVLAEVVAPPGEVPANWRYYPSTTFGYGTTPLVSPEETVQALAVYVRLATDAPGTPLRLIKLAPHMQTVPEPGVTVLVARAQDESEIPEVQSIIHTNGTEVVMPSGWTASSHVGSSYGTSYGDGKSIRFGLKSVPQLPFAVGRVTDAYNENLYKETSYSQGASYGYSCAESLAASPTNPGELYNKYAAEGKGDMLSASESFGSNYSRHHGAVVSGYSDIGISYNESVTGMSENISTVNGTSTNTATHYGDITSTTTVHAESATTSTHFGDITSTTTVHADSDSTATHFGDVSSVSTHLGDVSSINTILGNSFNVSTIAGINASLSAHDITLSASTTLAQASVNTVALTGSVNMTGLSVNSNTTLLSTNTNTTGVSMDTSLVGAHVSASLTGASATASITGASVSVDIKGVGAAYQETVLQIGAELRDIDVVTIALLRIYL
jgi:type VI secretion system secreted protein VgrG